MRPQFPDHSEVVVGGDAGVGLIVVRGAGEESLARARSRAQFSRVRALTHSLVEHLSDADASAQSMPDASPAKWHLAHTTWFFEAFVLAEHCPGYRPFDVRFAYLFNSYYEAKGERLSRAMRGVLTRPCLEEVFAYRRHVDSAIKAALDTASAKTRALIELGCQHEEQHQELLLTDVLHLFSQNPLAPSLWASSPDKPGRSAVSLRWIEGRRGLVSIGQAGKGFAFDCEAPRHTTWLSPHVLANRLTTNGEWLTFIDGGGYTTARHWLSDGWSWVQKNAIDAPLHWRRDDSGRWAYQFGLAGLETLDLDAPVQHVSLYEADAFARWADARLPTESEWESAAEFVNPGAANLLDEARAVQAMPARGAAGLEQMFGDLWEWTASPFGAYPGFRPDSGAIGEYNGKFMSGQFVLRGGSCATPRGHVRASYRNFFYPHQRWQFTGVRLARDL